MRLKTQLAGERGSSHSSRLLVLEIPLGGGIYVPLEMKGALALPNQSQECGKKAAHDFQDRICKNHAASPTCSQPLVKSLRLTCVYYKEREEEREGDMNGCSSAAITGERPDLEPHDPRT